MAPYSQVLIQKVATSKDFDLQKVASASPPPKYLLHCPTAICVMLSKTRFVDVSCRLLQPTQRRRASVERGEPLLGTRELTEHSHGEQINVRNESHACCDVQHSRFWRSSAKEQTEIAHLELFAKVASDQGIDLTALTAQQRAELWTTWNAKLAEEGGAAEEEAEGEEEEAEGEKKKVEGEEEEAEGRKRKRRLRKRKRLRLNSPRCTNGNRRLRKPTTSVA